MHFCYGHGLTKKIISRELLRPDCQGNCVITDSDYLEEEKHFKNFSKAKPKNVMKCSEIGAWEN